MGKQPAPDRVETPQVQRVGLHLHSIPISLIALTGSRMSDSSSLSGSQPSDAAIEEALRNVVRNIYRTGNLEELTVKRVRNAAEKRLDLQKDFFKDYPSWKDRSKSIIQIEVVGTAHCCDDACWLTGS